MNDGIRGFWLSPSYACNNRCRWCYVGGKLEKAPTMTLEQAKSYARKLKQGGAQRCILVGGEPTVYPNILSLIEYLTELEIETRMMTNGRRLSSMTFVQSLQRAGLTYCSISIEGIETIHDRITRVHGSFRESIAGVVNCLNIGLPVNTITTVSTYNKDSISKVAAYLQSFDLKRIVFNMCSSQPSGFGEIPNDGIIELHEYARIVEDVGLTYDKACFYALLPLCMYDQAKLRKLLLLGRLRVACSLLGNAVAIDPHGNLLPCTHMADLSYGNLNNENAVSHLLNTKRKEVDFLRTHAPSKKCVDCPLWTTCFGGCHLIWFSRSAEKTIPGIERERSLA